MTMTRKLELFIIFIFSAGFNGHRHGVTGMPVFSDEELAFFESLGLCDHFGGTCGSECPFRFITHKWGVPLCPQDSLSDLQCCIGPSPTESEDINELTLSTTTPSTTAAITTTSPPPIFETCGVLEGLRARKKRIVGGQTASQDTWPWLVAFRSLLGSHACSGAVIAQRWVITAAHCFKYVSKPGLWRVRVGEYNLLLQDVGERDVQVEEIILHPAYRSRLQNNVSNQTLHAQYVHDIALVRLSEDALTEPLCLPAADDDSFIELPEHSSDMGDTSTSENRQSDMNNDIESSPRFQDNSRSVDTDYDAHRYNEIPLVYYGRSSRSEYEESASLSRRGDCWVAGWGVTLDATVEDQVLHEVSGNMISGEECSRMWGEQLEDDMVCFGDGTYGPCAGDSGGPLSCERDGHFYLTGVVSWGTEDCNVKGYPSVFTNTRSYLSWIREQMNRHI